jgi:alpha-D-ribose 1-methylphosphonate 5-triphosphate diphosphatase PhnM
MARPQYPHLLPDDAAVWSRYLDTVRPQVETIYYDVRIGEGRPVGDEYSSAIQKMARDLSQRRIDAILVNGSTHTICEVTTTATLKAVGQLAVYEHLYRLQQSIPVTIKKLLVCSSIDADLKSYCDQFAIPYWVG